MKIGFFDSGVGGATIFKEAVNNIDAEYYYFADNLNMPYGVKKKEEVVKFSFDVVDKLVKKGCKIIVIACNTATSVAIKKLREKYEDIVFIGTEPAVKPAIENSNGKRVLVTATTITINGEKLQTLIEKLRSKRRCGAYCVR